MRILWVCHEYLGSDLDQTTQMEMLDALTRSGNVVHLLVPYCDARFVSEHIRSLPAVRWKYLSSLTFCVIMMFYLPLFARKKRIEVVLVDSASIFGTILVALLPRFSILLDIRSPPKRDELAGMRGLVIDLQYRLSLHFAKHICAGITVVSEQLKIDICRQFRIRHDFVGVWTSGVSTRLFVPDRDVSRRENLRKSLGFSDGFVLMYHGTLEARRGVRETIEALDALKVRCPNLRFLVLGAGPEETGLRRMIEQLRLEDRVAMLGRVDYKVVPDYISACDVGIFAFPIHGWWRASSPLKLLEYLAMEKPVIASDLPFNREVIEQGQCGILIQSNNPAEMSNAIERLYQNPELLQSMGKKGREFVERNHTWEAKAANLEEFLRARLKNRIDRHAVSYSF
ncbi:MAG: glycosyltransferase family 4 protein [Candidatus Bathyarchaeia archaeon]